MTDPVLEDRLRRNLRTIAELPIGRLEPLPQSAAPSRRKAFLLVAASAVAAAIIIAVSLGVAERPHRAETVTAPTPVQLPVPHGPNERLKRGSHNINVFSGPAAKSVISTTSLSVKDAAFTVQLIRESGSAFETYINFPGGGGDVVQAEQGEDTVAVTGATQATIWVGLPANTATVTYTYHGRTVWQQPINGIAAFAHSPVTTFRDTPSGTKDLAAHPSNDPLLRAYDANGDLIAQNVVYVDGPLSGLSDVSGATDH